MMPALASETSLAALDHVPIGALMLREDLVVVFWNRLLEEWTGLQREQILETRIDEHFAHLADPKYVERLRQVWEGGAPVIFSSQLHRQVIPSELPNGAPRIQHTTVTAIPAHSNDAFYALFAIQDVTDLTARIEDYWGMRDNALRETFQRRLAQEELQRAYEQLEHRISERTAELASANEHLRREIGERQEAQRDLQFTQFAVDHADECIYWMTPDGRFFYVNDAACRKLGYSRAELLSLSVYDIDTELELDESAEFWNMIRERRSFTAQSHHRTKEGHVFPVELTVNHIEFEGKDYNCSIVRDITERKVAEDRLRANEAELAHVARLSTMGELVAGIAHEINQPLYAIANFASAVERTLQASQNEQHRSLQMLNGQIAEQAVRAGEIIRRLRTFVGKSDGTWSMFDINTVVRDAVAMMQPLTRRKDVVIHLDLVNVPANVRADRVQIEQVLVNLIRNALEAVEESDTREVTVRTNLVEDTVSVTVKDTGVGIPPADITKSFDPFFTTKESGLGMGLAVSRTIIEAHFGRIWAVSRSDGGLIQFALPQYRD